MVVAVVVSLVMVVAVTVKVWVTGAAAVKLELPGCEAATATVPGPVIVSTLSAIFAGPCATVNMTGRPELAVAVNVILVLVCGMFGNAAKVMVWLKGEIVSVPGTKLAKT